MTPTRILILSCAALLAASSTAFAQRWGHGRTPRDGVCFYRNINFEGEYFCVDAGTQLGQIPEDMNDKISSFRMFGRAEVTIYKDRRFSGRSAHFTGDVRDLRRDKWNDAISSLEVRAVRPAISSREADRIVQRAYEDLLDRAPDDRGMRQYRTRIVDDGWTETQVRDDIKKSPEYRERMTMTPAKAEEIVRRAYQNVLKRDPDAGARSYVNKVLRDKWTQGDVERELRKSPEYRKR
jgi:hypothetical protein